MKRILVGGALVLLLLVGAILAYGVWFVRHAVLEDVKVRATARTSEKAIEVEVIASGSEDGAVVTVIDLDRSLRDAWGLGPPAGFVEAPMELEEGEKGDEEAAAYVTEYNREKIRYAGRAAVAPEARTVLRFAADRPDAVSGVIHLQYERKIGMGGSIAFVSVTVGADPPPSPVKEPAARPPGAGPSSSLPEGRGDPPATPPSP